MHHQFRGVLTARDAKQHFGHVFAVPEGATELRLTFDYEPERGPSGLNALHLTLFDARGFRGAGHRRGDVHDSVVTHIVELSKAHATPGYCAGALPTGEWSVVIDSHMIVADAPVTYEIVIDISCGPPDRIVEAEAGEVTARPASRGAGWYRGDLHGHTVHSDGRWQIADLLAHARARQLDFVTLSDHNTISGLVELDRLAQPDLLTMGGFELTTYAGHALALGVRQWIDWRVQPGTRTMPQIAADVDAAGGLFIIAHPMSVGDPICTGCDWRHRDMLPGPAHVVEVWNGEWEGERNNEHALALWYSWLNQGHRLVATAGTDIHGPLPDGARPGFNVVYADALSEAAILRAVAAGHLFLSDGPWMSLKGRTDDGAVAMMGDSLHAASATISARWDGCAADDQARLVVDGRVLFDQDAEGQGEEQWRLAAGEARWCVLEVRDARARLRSVTNPIFIDDHQ